MAAMKTLYKEPPIENDFKMCQFKIMMESWKFIIKNANRNFDKIWLPWRHFNAYK